MPCSQNPLDKNSETALLSMRCEDALLAPSEGKLTEGLLAKAWTGLGDPWRGTQDSWWPVTASGPEPPPELWLALQHRGVRDDTPHSLSCCWLPLAESRWSQGQASPGAGVLRGLPAGCRERWRVDQVRGQRGSKWRASGTGLGGRMSIL